ncbi:hypothetical protein N9N11_01925 [Candidatus Poseidoniales archaeon]|nr:hypothetical protein [Candidatus Poseidoniales archaeon]MDA8818516.1 hypothetical protein [Candidatus Poseidoniales archaeon]
MKRMHHHLADCKAADVGATHLLTGMVQKKSEQRVGGLHELCQAAWDNRREVSL